MVQFIIDRPLKMTTKTFTFKTRKEGFDFLASFGLLERIIDII